MTKFILHIVKAIFGIILGLLFFSCGSNILESISGSGNVITQKRAIGQEFTSVSAGSGLDVTLIPGKEQSVTIEADDNIVENIKTEVEGGELKIYIERNIRNASSKKVVVTFNTIEAVSASSGAQVKGNGTIKGDSMDFSSSSGASMEVSINANYINSQSSSGSHLILSGTTDDLETDSSSGSTLDAKGLAAQNVRSEASSGSTTIINPSDKLSADASSGGTIYYVKTPSQLDKETSSGGTVAQD